MSELLREPSYDEYVIIDGQKIPKDKDFLLILTRYKNNQDMTMDERIYMSMIDVWEEQAKEVLLSYMSKEKQNKIRRNLIKKGYLSSKELNPEDVKRMVIENSHKGQKCEWCGDRCYILHKHHFPITAKNGGTETVNICPNCHYTFHSIMKTHL